MTNQNFCGSACTSCTPSSYTTDGNSHTNALRRQQ